MDMETAGPVVLDTLSRACSQDASVLKPAEHQLQQWETQPGFYSIVARIFSNHDIDTNVRWLAVLYCKNGIDRYWRKTAPHALAETEKDLIRKQLISNFNEPVPQVATQVSVLTAKVARLDCPRGWPELIPTVLQAVRCNDQLVQERALLTLHHVTKMLASKRLAADRKMFEDVTKEIFGYVLSLWNGHLSHFLQLAGSHDEGMMVAVDRCILTLKILRKQTAFGFRELHTNPESVNFLGSIFPHLEAMLDCRRSLWGHHSVVEKCERVIVTLTKILLDVLTMHPNSFLGYIKTTLQFVVKYNFTEKGLLFERFAVNCFNLMKGILFSETYKPRKSVQEQETVSQISMEAHLMVKEFFTFQMLAEICRRLVLQYFLLTTDDLTTWDADAEEFCQEEGGDSFKYSLRPCTEVLFLTIFKEFRLSLTPILMEMVQSIHGPCDPDSLEAILKKDAIYNAVGLASYDLYDDIDFDNWFSSTLLGELRVKNDSYRIVRKRVIWLIGQWVSVKLSVKLRPTLYEAILSVLRTEEDLAVRLEAAATLRSAVDDFEFNPEQLLPYVEPLFSHLFQLLTHVRECDTKMHVLHVFSFVIERMGAMIRPYTAALLQYLPGLWQESADHNMLRCAILSTLIHLVQGFGSMCTNFHDFLLPVIHLSTDVTQDPHVYLLEDGLDLWLMTLHHSPLLTEGLLKLFNNMPSLLELGTENLRVCLKIIEAYILLGPRDFMQHFHSVLVSSLSSLMTDIRAEGLILILRLIELVFRAFPADGPRLFSPMLPGLLKDILAPEENPMLMSMYLSLFSRVLLQNQELMWSVLEQTAPHLGQDSQQALGKLLDLWCDKMDWVSQPERKKICALALSSLLTVNLSTVVEKFSSIINMCVEVLHDVCRQDEVTGVQIDFLVMGDQDGPPESGMEGDQEDNEHERRKKMLSRQDPVHSVSLKDYMVSQLTQCQQSHGQVNFDRLMESVDPDISSQLRMFCA
ncbi:importin-11-like [Haliotis rufescens]|uniref:importin-11-like n=1 Tax=Haliotis rufescens TaxID=6454 RepID=UPI00201F7F23|nr:importin-11-like [Haliotis rufescens]XP_048255115.1 importin-11-like [Haliotis rufescens]XP_048255116.1 importin-11-like [Haliotis rufescens]